MATSDETDPQLDFENEGGTFPDEPLAPEAETVETEAVVEEEAAEVPDVQIEANPDYEADGDVYVSVAEVPEEFRVSETDDRFLVGSATEVPPEFAEQLADTAAVQVVEAEEA